MDDLQNDRPKFDGHGCGHRQATLASTSMAKPLVHLYMYHSLMEHWVINYIDSYSVVVP